MKRTSKSSIKPGRFIDPTDPVVFECKRKIPYPTKIMADREAHAKSLQLGEKLESYPCKHCGKYHIGHPMASNRQEAPEPEVVFKNEGATARPRPPKEKPVYNNMDELIDTTSMAKISDDFRNLYVFQMPPEMNHSERNILEHGVLIATKKGEDVYRELDGSPSPKEKWRAYNLMTNNYTRNAVEFQKQITLHLDRISSTLDSKKLRMNPVLKGKLPMDLPQLEKFRDRQVWRDENNNPFIKHTIICCDCKTEIQMRARVSMKNGRFTSIQAYQPVTDKGARPKPRTRDWQCGSCAPSLDLAEAAKKVVVKKVQEAEDSAASIALVAAETAVKAANTAVEATRALSAKVEVEVLPPRLAFSARQLSFLDELERIVTNPEVSSQQVRGMAWITARALRSSFGAARV